VEWANFGREYKHHLNASNLDDLAALETPRGTRLHGLSIDLRAVAALYAEEPLFLLGIEAYDGMLARDGLARTEIDVDKVLVVWSRWMSGGRVGSATNVHLELCNIKGPVLSGNLGVGFDAILIRLVDSVGVVLAGLDALVFWGGEIMDDARD